MTTPVQEKKHWDDGAATYDSNDYTGEIVELLTAELKVGKVLEVGAGRGRLTHELAKDKRFKVYGIDISKGMLRYAPKGSVEYKVTAGRRIPYPSGYFDSVYSVTVFQHIDKAAKINYLLEAAHTLKKGGVLLLQFTTGYTQNDFDHNISPDEMRGLVEASGFKVDAQLALIHPLWCWVKATKK